MARYLFQAAYTSQAWRAQVDNPQSPLDRITPLVNELGGSIVEIDYCFGENDVLAIFEFADDQTMAAFALAVAAGGALTGAKTTKLLPIAEGVEALRRAKSVAGKYVSPVKELAHT